MNTQLLVGTETEEYWECEGMVSGITITMNLLQEMADDGLTIYNRLKEHNYHFISSID